ncbi:MAG: molybdopterin molybdotransferase MoeA [Desulfuromonadaceae bacterium]|nr:molybdopterin molybdotransferase MoeA [Desulfuromonadaceae bacterium]MDD5104435.1 molybdopterin molybdotransferase MoeA [Desulfuromonadaceae bacterium]
MVSIEEAQRVILSNSPLLLSETVPLLQGLGRVIAEDVHAPWDIPTTDNSAMDGYAFSSTSSGREQWVIAGFIPAGSELVTSVATGEAVKIMTGAPIPSGCDTVVPFEEVELTAIGIRLVSKVKPGAHIRKQGEDVRANDLVVKAGSLLRPQEIGLLVSLGRTEVTVYQKVRVAILATGDELLGVGTTPSSGRIINSNSYSLAAQVLEAGGEPIMIGIAADSKESTMGKIVEGLAADILITTGGVSVGDCDFVKESIQKLGGTLLFWKVRMKPGKPVAFALLESKPIFALPGNPVATMVAFEMFVRPSLLKMMGHSRIFRPVVRATLGEEMRNNGDRPHLVRVGVTLQHGVYRATNTGNQSSANLASLTRSNGLLMLDSNTTIVSESTADITLLDRDFEMGSISNVVA